MRESWLNWFVEIIIRRLNVSGVALGVRIVVYRWPALSPAVSGGKSIQIMTRSRWAVISRCRTLSVSVSGSIICDVMKYTKGRWYNFICILYWKVGEIKSFIIFRQLKIFIISFIIFVDIFFILFSILLHFASNKNDVERKEIRCSG